MPTSRAALFARLDKLGIKTRTLDHPATFTVTESQKLEKDLPGGHTKNLFLKSKRDELYLVVALNDANIHLNSLHKRLGCARLSFGNAELLHEVLGVVPGSVTPFALINDNDRKVTVILDAAMMKHDLLNYHPLENTATTNIARDDLLRFITACGHTPQILDVSAGMGSGAAND